MVSRLEQIDAVLQAPQPSQSCWFLSQVEKSLSSDNGFNLRRANEKHYSSYQHQLFFEWSVVLQSKCFLDLEKAMDHI